MKLRGHDTTMFNLLGCCTTGVWGIFVVSGLARQIRLVSLAIAASIVTSIFTRTSSNLLKLPSRASKAVGDPSRCLDYLPHAECFPSNVYQTVPRLAHPLSQFRPDFTLLVSFKTSVLYFSKAWRLRKGSDSSFRLVGLNLSSRTCSAKLLKADALIARNVFFEVQHPRALRVGSLPSTLALPVVLLSLSLLPVLTVAAFAPLAC